MGFLIQDLLDFAQIKTGKLRVNVKEFNIREAFEEVMSIQREQATAKGVELHVSYVNICKELNVLDSDQVYDSNYELYSPIMKSDINRIQQVILNL